MIDEKEIARLRTYLAMFPLDAVTDLATGLLDEVERLRKDAEHAARMSATTISEYAAKVERMQSALTAAQKHNAETLRGLRDTLATTAAKANLARAEKAERERDEARAQSAALRLLVEQHECAPCPGFDRDADGQERVRRITIDTNAGRDILDVLVRAEVALAPFRELGRPRPPLLAFHDLEGDIVVYSNSGVHITAGDVRRLQDVLAELRKTKQ